MKKFLIILLFIPSLASAQGFGTLNVSKASQLKVDSSSWGHFLPTSATTVQNTLNYINAIGAGSGSGSGTVTSIATSNGITGGTITTSGTISGVNAAADGATKGVAAFNATNFTASSGVINTIQNISTSSSPTFTKVTATSMVTQNLNDGILSGLTVSSNDGNLSLTAPSGDIYIQSNANHIDGDTSINGNLNVGAYDISGGANLSLTGLLRSTAQKNSFFTVSFGDGSGGDNYEPGTAWALTPFSTLTGYLKNDPGGNWDEINNVYNVPYDGYYKVTTSLRPTDLSLSNVQLGVGTIEEFGNSWGTPPYYGADNATAMWVQFGTNTDGTNFGYGRGGMEVTRVMHCTGGEHIFQFMYEDTHNATIGINGSALSIELISAD